MTDSSTPLSRAVDELAVILDTIGPEERAPALQILTWLTHMVESLSRERGDVFQHAALACAVAIESAHAKPAEFGGAVREAMDQAADLLAEYESRRAGRMTAEEIERLHAENGGGNV